VAEHPDKITNTVAYPLWNNGSFTWNKKTRQLIFMRAGSPESSREEMRKPTSFYVEGNDIKQLYQVLHSHFMAPHQKFQGGSGKSTREWDESLPHPEWDPLHKPLP
jgi:hypothetical protein